VLKNLRLKGESHAMKDPTIYGAFLWFFLFLFLLRVVGQVLVVTFHPSWLPPMPQWYSGLIPYRFLLPIQILMLILMAAMARDFSRGEGLFVSPRPGVGQGVLWFSYLYAGSMVIRYSIRMWNRPDQRWFGGTIPIVFHGVLASFLFVFGRYHAL
jgi:hypothetical protein